MRPNFSDIVRSARRVIGALFAVLDELANLRRLIKVYSTSQDSETRILKKMLSLIIDLAEDARSDALGVAFLLEDEDEEEDDLDDETIRELYF